MKIVRFVKDHSPYAVGDVAGLSDDDADVRLRAGVCELVEEHKKSPDMRVGTAYDEEGNLVHEAVIVPKDLERNVDLPLTAPGQKPGEETPEEYTEAEEETARKAVKGPRENKMVDENKTRQK